MFVFNIGSRVKITAEDDDKVYVVADEVHTYEDSFAYTLEGSSRIFYLEELEEVVKS